MVSNPFVKGAVYVAKREFSSGPSQFDSGERLQFDRQTFSPYDNSYAFVFRSLENGTEKYWLVHTNSSSDSWRECFEVEA